MSRESWCDWREWARFARVVVRFMQRPRPARRANILIAPVADTPQFSARNAAPAPGHASWPRPHVRRNQCARSSQYLPQGVVTSFVVGCGPAVCSAPGNDCTPARAAEFYWMATSRLQRHGHWVEAENSEQSKKKQKKNKKKKKRKVPPGICLVSGPWLCVLRRGQMPSPWICHSSSGQKRAA
ncbi:hypothetical protein METBIDRAFT_120813 [Metschnikowia bicuspidata var. bicuspidata NRRL YB-4993]|uniref:Uncharacterized protein n=1 Tax=Metschnikowia bicuspidata var. bicuspidata NRRL YB-4993 TaxID=869754 RepID=A0A1A0HJQ0_9ASCO|nr:hypothetical protein METBIDRAFT_120813 [Metschnikowia bicuspidata var. bicuspidata NRRL YB-4993]OBA24226.1 hypothetical protein METBIDRAFT_120813 [Metschnikowia bicuspidata var. bicuspidata NRRL YB-4993]